MLKLTYAEQYVTPKDVQIIEVLNNRVLDQNYISDLQDSMESIGYLTQYPVKLFPSEIITFENIEQPYVVACGAHRIQAAQLAEVEVYAHLYTGGTFEEYIEMMSLDNFRFDPAKDSAIGQVFTQQEKRKSCIQLLLLEKYLIKTNTALGDEWNTRESNVRNWRKEVQAYLETNSPFLRMWGVTEERQAALKAILASTERENAKGEIVQVRQPVREATDDEKREFYGLIQKSAKGRVSADEDSETWLDFHDIEFSHVSGAAAKRFETQKSEWYLWQYCTMQQLKKLHRWILDGDPEFVADCKAEASAEQKMDDLTAEVDAAIGRLIDAIHEKFCQGTGTAKNSDRFRDLKREFESCANTAGIPIDFPYGSFYSKSEEECRAALTAFRDALDAVETDAEWVQSFEVEYIEKAQRQLEKAREDWYTEKKNLIAAIEAYPRQIETAALLYAADKKFYHTAGDHAKFFSREKIAIQTKVDALNRQIQSFKKMVEALQENDDWIRAIPTVEKLPLQEGIDEMKQSEATTDLSQNCEASPSEVSAETPQLKNPLLNVSLDGLFEHIENRVISLPVEAERLTAAMAQILEVLGEVSNGLVGTQLWVLAKIGQLIGSDVSETADASVSDVLLQMSLKNVKIDVDSEHDNNFGYIIQFDSEVSDAFEDEGLYPLSDIPINALYHLLKIAERKAISTVPTENA